MAAKKAAPVARDRGGLYEGGGGGFDDFGSPMSSDSLRQHGHEIAKEAQELFEYYQQEAQDRKAQCERQEARIKELEVELANARKSNDAQAAELAQNADRIRGSQARQLGRLLADHFIFCR